MGVCAFRISQIWFDLISRLSVANLTKPIVLWSLSLTFLCSSSLHAADHRDSWVGISKACFCGFEVMNATWSMAWFYLVIPPIIFARSPCALFNALPFQRALLSPASHPSLALSSTRPLLSLIPLLQIYWRLWKSNYRHNRSQIRTPFISVRVQPESHPPGRKDSSPMPFFTTLGFFARSARMICRVHIDRTFSLISLTNLVDVPPKPKIVRLIIKWDKIFDAYRLPK